MKRMVDIPSAPEDGKNYSLKINNGKMTWVEDSDEPVAAGGQWYCYYVESATIVNGVRLNNFAFYTPFKIELDSLQLHSINQYLVALRDQLGKDFVLPAFGYISKTTTFLYSCNASGILVQTSPYGPRLIIDALKLKEDGSLDRYEQLTPFDLSTGITFQEIVLPTSFVPTQAMLASLPVTLAPMIVDVEEEVKEGVK